MRRLRPSYFVLGAGIVVLLVGGYVLLAPWYEAAQWRDSPEAARALRNAEAPTLVAIAPVRPTPVATPFASAAIGDTPVATPSAMTDVLGQPTTSAATADVAAVPTTAPTEVLPPTPTLPPPTPTLAPSDLTLTASAFKFVDPPEPGAHAQLDLTIHNPTGQASDRVSVSLPVDWLSGYKLDSMEPGPIDGNQTDKALTLSFPGPAAHADADLTFGVETTDEVIDSPNLVVLDAEGRKVGSAHPPTQAPPAKPGPIYSIDIPRLKLHSGVVPVDWEPPLFVVGQVRTSAWVTLGNSVLVGHVRGATGYNVFDHLDQVQPGDEIIANSRGEPYDFVVSDTQVLPEDDFSLTDTTSMPRLTLMTCTGDFNPITRDYDHRLWVVAEPAWADTPPPHADDRRD